MLLILREVEREDGEDCNGVKKSLTSDLVKRKEGCNVQKERGDVCWKKVETRAVRMERRKERKGKGEPGKGEREGEERPASVRAHWDTLELPDCFQVQSTEALTPTPRAHSGRQNVAWGSC